ncbi:MAG: hypothetical protein BIFFINMI_04072 [Phycisphaerae bacterium]|nr:hypothetical protein [Phycisphaerae bacterium]
MKLASLVALMSLALAATVRAQSPLADRDAGRTLVCRGYEDSGNITEDQPMWPCHLVTLFVTGKDPHSAIFTPAEHCAWAADAAHSYVDDGTGALVVWAHPNARDAEALLATPHLAGMEITHGGDSSYREGLWDRVLTGCHDAGRAYLWGFASDDTHSRMPDEISLSFCIARLGEFSERALKEALARGRFYVSNGPLIGDIQVAGGKITISLPAAAEVRWLRSGQYGAGRGGLAVGPAPGENHCLQRDVNVKQSSYALNDADGTTDPKAARFIRALVIAPGDGKQGEEKFAQTMPMRILADGRLDNPYPAEGKWYRGQTHNHCDSTGLKETAIIDYHRAYASAGHHWRFATDYGYWATPFEIEPDTLVRISGVTPDRGPRGAATRVTIIGRMMPAKPRVLIGGRESADVRWVYDNRVEATVPADLPPGVYDVTVLDGAGFKDTLADAFTVQSPGADNAGWRSWKSADGFAPGERTFAVAFEKDGAAWVGTEFGAGRLDAVGGRWQGITRLNSEFIGDPVRGVAVDGKGGVWFAHFRGLTHRRPDGSWEVFDARSGLPSRDVNRVFVAADDTIWITFNGRSSMLSHYDGKTWTNFAPPNGKDQPMSLAVSQDAAGRILVAPRDSGVAAWDGKAWATWTAADSGLPDNMVRHIRRGPDGTLYFATTAISGKPVGGLAVLRDSKWTTYPQSAGGLASYRVWDVLVDRAGNVWCATSCGVSRLAPDGRWKTFTTANSGLAFDFVMGLGQAPDGAIWFATARGVSRFMPS